MYDLGSQLLERSFRFGVLEGFDVVEGRSGVALSQEHGLPQAVRLEDEVEGSLHVPGLGKAPADQGLQFRVLLAGKKHRGSGETESGKGGNRGQNGLLCMYLGQN